MTATCHCRVLLLPALSRQPLPLLSLRFGWKISYQMKLTLGNYNLKGRLSTIVLLIKVACFVKQVNDIFSLKGAYLNLAFHGGQPY